MKPLSSGWKIDVEEVSVGTYRVTARNDAGLVVDRTGTDPDALRSRVAAEAIELEASAARARTAGGAGPVRRVLVAVAAFTPWLCLLGQIPLLRVLADAPPGQHIPMPYAEFTLGLASVVVAGVAVLGFALHARHNRVLEPGARNRWAIALVLLNGFALPAYWWRHLRTPSAAVS